jgi:hypothetical protein
MALEELTGYPYEIYGPAQVDGVAYGFHGTDTLPTGAEYLCDGADARRLACYLVLMDLPEPPDDLPHGWTATAYAMRDDWASDDGTWIVKAMHQKADGSWVFAGYLRA